ncbi:alpha/beta fold hydrolase [Novosphingobium aureum]|nr:alpha/beta hydrolase [Novosphingobium aureum]
MFPVRYLLKAGLAAASLSLSGVALPAFAQESVTPLGSDLEDFVYPWPVRHMPLTVGAQAAQMAYMDVSPEHPNGQSVVLLHGKNFCGATWESTARALLGAGYRVVIPDQLGFCKSSKPREAQYSFAMMADATHRLLEGAGVEKPIVLAHSTGGMLALRYALMFPDDTARLVLIDPLGLVDRMEEGVPYVPLDKLLETERGKTRESIKRYQLNTYYHGNWRPEYDRWVDMLAGQYATSDDDAVELAQAKTAEMILTQPVSHEFGSLQVPVTLMIGRLDTTTFGKGQAPEAVKARLRPIPEVAQEAAARMPSARIVWFEGRGHSPQVEAPAEFEPRLLEVLEKPAP